MRPIPHLRWHVAILLCLASELNYLDRQALSALNVTIQQIIGRVVGTAGYAPLFIGAAAMYLTAFVLVFWLVGELGRASTMEELK